jgi:hypothetical protein
MKLLIVLVPGHERTLHLKLDDILQGRSGRDSVIKIASSDFRQILYQARVVYLAG